MSDRTRKADFPIDCRGCDMLDTKPRTEFFVPAGSKLICDYW